MFHDFQVLSCRPQGVGLFPAAAASFGGSPKRFYARLAAGTAGGTAARPWRVSPGEGIFTAAFVRDIREHVVSKR